MAQKLAADKEKEFAAEVARLRNACADLDGRLLAAEDARLQVRSKLNLSLQDTGFVLEVPCSCINTQLMYQLSKLQILAEEIKNVFARPRRLRSGPKVQKLSWPLCGNSKPRQVNPAVCNF